MKEYLTYILLILAVICGSVQYASAQIYDEEGQYVDTIFHDHINRQAEDFVIVSLLVADPTDWRDDFMGVLGHAFIRLQCPVFGLDNCFSYECEPAKDNLGRFLKGELKMGMFRYTTDSQLDAYRAWNRTIHEYQLNLPPEAEQRLWEIMDNHVNNGTKLPMDMYKRGCAISLVHFVTEALGDSKIEYHEWPEEFKKSRYELIHDALDNYPWLQIFLFKTIDKRFDKPCSNEEKLVIPVQLAEVWQSATLNGEPFATYLGDLTTGTDRVVEKTYFTPMVALVVLLLLIGCGIGAVVWRKSKKQKQ